MVTIVTLSTFPALAQAASQSVTATQPATTLEALGTLAIALGLGLLVGLQRERKGDVLAGIRTFALITIFGTLAAMTGRQFGSWVVPAGAVALGGLMAVGALIKARIHEQEIGLTTEIAALVMYGLGAYLVGGDRQVAVVAGGAVALLLYWKAPLHGFVQRMGDQDVAAIMQFVLIAVVILPVLPNRRLGPYDFFNPFEVWLVVVFVVGMSLVGYVLYKLVPPSTGALLGGLIGGMISSTATTVSYARRTRGNPETAAMALQAIMMANTVSVLRVMLLLTIFAGGAIGAATKTPGVVAAMVPPLAVMAGALGVLCAAAWWVGRREHAEMPAQANPAELKAALFFGTIYAAVKLATAWGKATYGASALYIVAAISGLTDVDAITLSMSESARNASVAAALAWRIILVAVLSNLVFKAGCVFVLGNSRLKLWVAAHFGLAMAAGIAILWTWPG